jgi:hypothetical protein
MRDERVIPIDELSASECLQIELVITVGDLEVDNIKTGPGEGKACGVGARLTTAGTFTPFSSGNERQLLCCRAPAHRRPNAGAGIHDFSK